MSISVSYTVENLAEAQAKMAELAVALDRAEAAGREWLAELSGEPGDKPRDRAAEFTR